MLISNSSLAVNSIESWVFRQNTYQIEIFTQRRECEIRSFIYEVGKFLLNFVITTPLISIIDGAVIYYFIDNVWPGVWINGIVLCNC